MLRCLISTSSFGKIVDEPLHRLARAGFAVQLNPFGRKLRKKEALELYAQTDVVIAGVEDIDVEVFEAAKSLKVISRCGIGTDSVDMAEAKRRGIPVLITPEPPAQAVAELTIGLIFALSRRICESDAGIRRGEWKPLMGAQLSGKTLGVLGLGRVGRKVIRVFRALGLDVVGYDPYPDQKFVEEYEVRLASIEEVAAVADILTMHVPLMDSTRNLVNEEFLAKMKAGAFLVNTSRGGIVDETALVHSLQRNHLGGAALDVFEQEPYEGELRGLSNVVLTAHMGSYAAEARNAMEAEAVANLIAECQRQGLIQEA